jgi:Protein of unknown function (DUF3306)
MSDPDDFLSRWSRRKREAGIRPEKDKDKDKDNETNPVSARDGQANPEKPISPAAPPIPELDVSKLPPIESIGADTDISVFMQKGVPSALRHAALRRAWSADPTIRDFIGPNENFWDAAGPDGIPGFGDLDPGLDVKRMVAALFGETKRESTEPDVVDSSKASTAVTENSADNGERESASMPVEKSPDGAENSSQRTENAATQKDTRQSQPLKKIVRRHGSAMPE